MFDTDRPAYVKACARFRDVAALTKQNKLAVSFDQNTLAVSFNTGPIVWFWLNGLAVGTFEMRC